MHEFINVLLFIAWIGGLVIAKGFWSTFFAFIFPLYSWYLVIERFIKRI